MFLITNSLIQSIPRRSRPIWSSFFDGTNELCVTTEILEEYEEILERLVNIQIAKYTIELIVNSSSTIFVTPYYNFNLIKGDSDDNKFVDCAIAANAKFIVTEDRHFDILKSYTFPRVEIVSLDNFLEML